MDLNLSALIGVSYLVPIAVTLRRLYAPDFNMPETFAPVLARLDARARREPTLARRRQRHDA